MSDIIVLIGPQGAGKGTQAQMLAEKLSLPIIATGEILRSVALADTEIGRQVRDIQAAGRLVSDQVLTGIVSDRIDRGDCAKGCILDGFPRTLGQAEHLDKIAEAKGYRIIVIDIEVPRDLLWKRLTGRRNCPVCQSTYNLYFKPSKQEGHCDLDGQPLFARSDDTEEAIAKRLSLYDEKTLPLLSYYRERGKAREVDGTGSPEEVFSRILSAVSGTTGAGGRVGSAE
jgi:adenylate kinase